MLYPYQQPTKPCLVPLAGKQVRHLFRWQAGKELGHSPRLRHTQAQKFIAFTIFSRPGFKELHEHLALFVIA